jgi:hypothetical protein
MLQEQSDDALLLPYARNSRAQVARRLCHLHYFDEFALKLSELRDPNLNLLRCFRNVA